MPFAPEKKTYTETRKRGSDSYVKFTAGEKIVLRILDTNARLVWKHWIPEANGGRGLMATCPNTATSRICPIDESLKGLEKDDPTVNERRAKTRFIVNVLDRTPYTVCESCNTTTSGKVCKSCGTDIRKQEFVPLNQVKVLEQGPRLFRETLNAIERSQADDFDGVDITGYDIVFTTIGTGRDKKIQAIPKEPEELQEEWLLDPETQEPQKLFDLELLSEPSSVEEIEAMLKGATIQELNAIRGIV